MDTSLVQLSIYDKDITFWVVMGIGMAFTNSAARNLGHGIHDFTLARELRNEAKMLRSAQNPR